MSFDMCVCCATSLHCSGGQEVRDGTHRGTGSCRLGGEVQNRKPEGAQISRPPPEKLPHRPSGLLPHLLTLNPAPAPHPAFSQSPGRWPLSCPISAGVRILQGSAFPTVSSCTRSHVREQLECFCSFGVGLAI